MVDLVLTKAKSTKWICPFLDSPQHPWRDNAWTKGKTGKEATVALAAEDAEAAGGGTVLASDVITRAALAESAKVMTERELAGTRLACVTRIVHSLAVAGCLGDGGLAVASGYLVVVTTMLAKRGPQFAILYDEKLRRLACETEDMTVADVSKLFHVKDSAVISEVLLDLELPKPSQRPAQQQQQQQRPRQAADYQQQARRQRPRHRPPSRGRGPPAAADKRPREASFAPAPGGAPKGGKGKGGQGDWAKRSRGGHRRREKRSNPGLDDPPDGDSLPCVGAPPVFPPPPPLAPPPVAGPPCVSSGAVARQFRPSPSLPPSPSQCASSGSAISAVPAVPAIPTVLPVARVSDGSSLFGPRWGVHVSDLGVTWVLLGCPTEGAVPVHRG